MDAGLLGAQDRVVDGSGLSRANKLSAASLTRGGEGTLIRRLRPPELKNRVRANSGSLNGVTSLSGRVVSRCGHRYAFAILIEADDTAGGRRLQYGVVNLLARGIEDPVSSATGS